MIGGCDIVIPAVGDSASLAACARIVQRHWPNARYENAVTGDKFDRLNDVPFGQVSELLAYRDADAEKAWDNDSADAAENGMISLIVRPNDVTVVVDNPNSREIRSMLKGIRSSLAEGCEKKVGEHLGAQDPKSTDPIKNNDQTL